VQDFKHIFMKTIKYICVNLNIEEVFVCTTTTALARYIGITTQTLRVYGINKSNKLKYKHFIVFVDTDINKLKRGRKSF